MRGGTSRRRREFEKEGPREEEGGERRRREVKKAENIRWEWGEVGDCGADDNGGGD